MPAHPVGPKVEVRLPPELLATVDSMAAAHGHTRAETLRLLVERGMSSPTTSGPQGGSTGGCEAERQAWEDKFTYAMGEADKYRSAMRIEKSTVIAKVRELEATRAALTLAEAQLQKTGADLAEARATIQSLVQHRADNEATVTTGDPELLDLLKSCVPHLPNNRLRQRVQQVTS